ncbi:MAG: DNA adenine methylase [Chitinispirillia bacterium]|jgi:site-specific DNA-adenine methylase
MKYPGGKGLTFQRLINLMPPHEVYIETHLGGGSIIRNKRPAQVNIGIEIDSKVIEQWKVCHRHHSFELLHDDALTYLKRYHFTGKELVYCDPPYLRETRKKRDRLYRYDYSKSQHIELLKVLQCLPCMVMISGYHSNLYKESLKGWHTYSFQSATHHGMSTEWVWMNYSSPTELHDYRYVGDNFRQRERIRNKSKRWVKRLKGMDVLERQALLSAIRSVTDEEAVTCNY